MAALDADVVGLMEIENNGDTAVQNLVDGAQRRVGAGTYASVALPAGRHRHRRDPGGHDLQAGALTPVGSALSDTDADPQPPAAGADLRGRQRRDASRCVVNHFKSKGSCPADGGADADQGDGQGCWNALRVQQAQRPARLRRQRAGRRQRRDVLRDRRPERLRQEDPIDRPDRPAASSTRSRASTPSATPTSSTARPATSTTRWPRQRCRPGDRRARTGTSMPTSRR